MVGIEELPTGQSSQVAEVVQLLVEGVEGTSGKVVEARQTRLLRRRRLAPARGVSVGAAWLC